MSYRNNVVESDSADYLKIAGVVAAAIAVVLFIIFLFIVKIYVIESREVGVVTRFGIVQQDSTKLFSPGLHVVFFGSHVTPVSLVQKQLMLDSSKVGTVLDVDHIPVNFDVTIPYSYNARCAGHVVAIGGTSATDDMFLRSATAAMRDATSEYAWMDMVSTKRRELAFKIRDYLDRYVSVNLASQGFPEGVAKNCITISEVQLQSILPPNSVSAALADQAAVQVRKDSQKGLNEIAQMEADRRSIEGQGIANVMDKLPTKYSPEDVYRVMAAVAIKENADALERAVREGKITLMVVPGNTPVSVPAPIK